MNGMDGVSAAKKLRENNGACLLIFLTSCGERMPEAFSCHAFEYIIKPFTPERVGNVLRDAFARLPIRVRDRLKIEQAARDYNFAKIRGVQRRGKG